MRTAEPPHAATATASSKYQEQRTSGFVTPHNPRASRDPTRVEYISSGLLTTFPTLMSKISKDNHPDVGTSQSGPPHPPGHSSDPRYGPNPETRNPEMPHVTLKCFFVTLKSFPVTLE